MHEIIVFFYFAVRTFVCILLALFGQDTPDVKHIKQLMPVGANVLDL